MKDAKEILLNRRSVRRYERKPIEPEKLEYIYKAIQNTPTSYNGQQFSVIAVTDQDIKLNLYAIMGQKQVKTCAVFLIFCIDFHQLEVASEEKGVTFPDFHNTVNGYTVGVVDASLAMGNAITAAESLGLGTCCIGYARTADPKATSEILGLPPKTAIVCGLAIGYPNETPDMKPKRPLSLVIHDNRYKSDPEMRSQLMEYDRCIEKFNCQRSGNQTDNDWIDHILDYHRLEKQKNIESYLKSQKITLEQKI